MFVSGSYQEGFHKNQSFLFTLSENNTIYCLPWNVEKNVMSDYILWIYIHFLKTEEKCSQHFKKETRPGICPTGIEIPECFSRMLDHQLLQLVVTS